MIEDAVRACGPGVAVAAYVDGELVVDVQTDGLRPDSLVHTWSAIKPVTGAVLLSLGVDLDLPVTDVWPEIGDDRLLVRHLLTHTAGRISVPADVPLTDWDASVAALAGMPPDWPPGEVICEHAKTFGHLVGEFVRRVSGRTVGTLVRELVDDVFVGVPDAELWRCADTVGLTPVWHASIGSTEVRRRAMGPYVDVNTREWRQAEVPAVNGHATARGLASFWQRLLDGRLPAGVATPGVTGHDRFVDEEVTWTLAGGRVDDGWIGMGGLGGQWAAAHPDLGVAWAFLTTHVAGAPDRAQRVEDALLARLGR